MLQLTHHGADDPHLALATFLQALGPRLKERAAPQRCDGWKAQGSTQTGITDL
jgi:hypothetical protein